MPVFFTGSVFDGLNPGADSEAEIGDLIPFVVLRWPVSDKRTHSFLSRLQLFLSNGFSEDEATAPARRGKNHSRGLQKQAFFAADPGKPSLKWEDNVICYRCGLEGHIGRNCTTPAVQWVRGQVAKPKEDPAPEGGADFQAARG
uniref:CCHC-type domain-containing protein n=1 Tax=Mycena chlorophos TaxID=658473 RepID=A0ABQ0LS20_MYCCL|nr:predicted protein [Mycena chlorophos]